MKEEYVADCNREMMRMGIEMLESGQMDVETGSAIAEECTRRKEALIEQGLTEEQVRDLANQRIYTSD